MAKRILLIQGHPDTNEDHLCHALAHAYADGAHAAGHALRHIKVAALDFPLLRNEQQWERDPLPDGLRQAQADLLWAEHLVLIFPLWLGDMPALLKGFLEQIARPGFAFAHDRMHPLAGKRLMGRSARVVVTMGMAVPARRWFFHASILNVLKRHVLGFIGIAPVSQTLIGMAANPATASVADWIGKLEQLGREGG